MINSFIKVIIIKVRQLNKEAKSKYNTSIREIMNIKEMIAV